METNNNIGQSAASLKFIYYTIDKLTNLLYNKKKTVKE